jgi:calmodulin
MLAPPAPVRFAMLQDLSDEEEILRRAFQFFDKDGNGEISVHELRTTMHELGDLLTEDEIMSFMAIMDIDNDGVIGVCLQCSLLLMFYFIVTCTMLLRC